MQKYIVEIDDSGSIFWFNFETGKYHRENGPAVEYSDGYKEWWLEGKRHRTDGPAVEYSDGYKEWWFNGKRHRTDGPAIEWPNSNKQWRINGKLHRIDGPAIDYKEWWINDKRLTEEEFNKRTNSCEGKTVEIDGKKYKLTLCE